MIQGGEGGEKSMTEPLILSLALSDDDVWHVVDLHQLQILMKTSQNPYLCKNKRHQHILIQDIPGSSTSSLLSTAEFTTVLH